LLILHLSDLHFGNKNRFSHDAPGELSQAFYRSVQDAIRDIGSHSEIVLVVISGDLAETGLPSEFKYAREFLTTLAAQLQLRPERFVILPGNHDIAWPECQIVRSGLEGEKFPATELDDRLNAAKLSNYRAFLGDLYGGDVTDISRAGLPDCFPLGRGGWLRNFPDLK